MIDYVESTISVSNAIERLIAEYEWPFLMHFGSCESLKQLKRVNRINFL